MATQNARGAKNPTTRAGKSTAGRSATTKTTKSSRSASTGRGSTGKTAASKASRGAASKSTARKAGTRAASKTTTMTPTKRAKRIVGRAAKSSAPTALRHPSFRTPTRRGLGSVKQGYVTGSPQLTRPRGTVEPGIRLTRLDPTARKELRELDELVASAEEITVVVGTENRRLPIKGALLEMLAKVMGALDRGTTLTVLGEDDSQIELTSQEAADLLNVSRPYVVKLARGGVLPHRRVGNRHRFALADVLAHREQMLATGEEALTELAPTGGYTAGDF